MLLPSLSVFLIALMLPTTGWSMEGSKCGQEADEAIDLEMVRFIGLGKNKIGRSFPTNQAELNAFCRESHRLGNKIEAHIQRCFTDPVQTLAKLVFYTSRGIERKFCRSKSIQRSRALQKLIAVSPCFNRYGRSNTSCIDTFKRELEEIILWPPERDNLRLPYSCCSYVRSMECVEEIFDTQECLRRNKLVMMDWVRSLTGPFVDMMCGEYNEYTDSCAKLPPMPKLPPGVHSNKTYHSVMFPLIDFVLTTKTEQRGSSTAPKQLN